MAGRRTRSFQDFPFKKINICTLQVVYVLIAEYVTVKVYKQIMQSSNNSMHQNLKKGGTVFKVVRELRAINTKMYMMCAF